MADSASGQVHDVSDTPELRLREIRIAADKGLVIPPAIGWKPGFVRTWFIKNWNDICMRLGINRAELRT